MLTIELSNNIFGNLQVDSNKLIGSFCPHNFSANGLTDDEIADRLRNPIGTPPISELARGRKNILIVTDDNTRLTPLTRILPPVLQELKQANITDKQITILIGLGTHRAMTGEEIREKFGGEIAENYRIVNHAWDDPRQLVSLGQCELGFEVIINRLAIEADFIISVGSIIPHATAGYSGGGKTIMPGIGGEKTIADTHWAALQYNMNEILGNAENRVRQAIISVCRKVGLDVIVNSILFNGDQIYDLIAGDVDAAQRQGIKKADEVYGVRVPEKADIVVAEAYPTDIDLRQSIKAVCSADLVCKDNGVIILLAECPEGIAPQFPDFEKYGFKNPELIYQDVETGKFKQKLLAYTLVAVGRIISKRIKAILVSPNIKNEQAKRLGFCWARDLQTGVDLAKELTFAEAKIMILKQAGEILPKIDKYWKNG